MFAQQVYEIRTSTQLRKLIDQYAKKNEIDTGKYTICLELDSRRVSEYDTPDSLGLEEREKLYAIVQKISVAVDEDAL